MLIVACICEYKSYATQTCNNYLNIFIINKDTHIFQLNNIFMLLNAMNATIAREEGEG